MTRTTNNGWENSSGCVITGKTGFAHTRSIVDDKSGYFIITHFLKFYFFFSRKFEKK